jgi:hypothetical protein
MALPLHFWASTGLRKRFFGSIQVSVLQFRTGRYTFAR